MCPDLSNRPRRTTDSIRVSEAPDPGSIPGEATSPGTRLTRDYIDSVIRFVEIISNYHVLR